MAEKKDPKFAGRPAFARLRNHLLRTDIARDVEWEYRLGVLVDELCPRDRRAYGHGNVQSLADELGDGLTSANKLWSARKLGIAMPWKELEGLLRKAKKVGFELTASHVLSLVAVKKEDERAAIGNRCVEHGWGVKQLRREIHRVQGKQSQGGAKLSKPTSVDEALQDLLDRSRDWLNRYEQAWFAEGSNGLLRPISKAASVRLGGKLDDAITVLMELRQAADEGRRRLRELRTGNIET
jgi:hypothetical protein